MDNGTVSLLFNQTEGKKIGIASTPKFIAESCRRDHFLREAIYEFNNSTMMGDDLTNLINRLIEISYQRVEVIEEIEGEQ